MNLENRYTILKKNNSLNFHFIEKSKNFCITSCFYYTEWFKKMVAISHRCRPRITQCICEWTSDLWKRMSLWLRKKDFLGNVSVKHWCPSRLNLLKYNIYIVYIFRRSWERRQKRQGAEWKISKWKRITIF